MIRRLIGVAHGSVAELWTTGLVLKPVDNLVVPVADGPADPETTRPRAEVSPRAQGRLGYADEGGDLLQRHQLVIGMGEFGVLGKGCGAHGGSP